MTEIGIYLDTTDRMIKWDGAAIPMKERGILQQDCNLQFLYNMTQSSETLRDAEQRQSHILDADYSKVDIVEHVNGLNYLSESEKTDLIRTLSAYADTLFSGGLGTLNVPPVKLRLKKDAKPYRARAYAVPKSLEATTKKEFDRLEQIQVLAKGPPSEWTAPTFIIPKKTGDVRVVTDFRRLNEATAQEQYLLPKIADLLQKLLCTTVMPWGTYRYLRLPMGISNSPDIF